MSEPPVAPTHQERALDDAALLRAYLAGREVPCPQCGYNLRDLIGNRCPECGEELTLRLQLSEPKQSAALAGLIALSAGAGFNGIFLGWAFIAIVIRREPAGDTRPLVILIAECVLMAALIAMWLRYWRHIRRLGVIRRWVLVAACAALSLANAVIFIKLF